MRFNYKGIEAKLHSVNNKETSLPFHLDCILENEQHEVWEIRQAKQN